MQPVPRARPRRAVGAQTYGANASGSGARAHARTATDARVERQALELRQRLHRLADGGGALARSRGRTAPASGTPPARARPRRARGRRSAARGSSRRRSRRARRSCRGTPRLRSGRRLRALRGRRPGSSRCSGASSFARASAASSDATARSAPARSSRASTPSATRLLVVTRIDSPSGPCSAWASRSAAHSSGSARLVGDHEHLARPGGEVDRDVRRDEQLRLGHVAVSRADDLGDRRRSSRCRRRARRSPGRRRST